MGKVLGDDLAPRFAALEGSISSHPPPMALTGPKNGSPAEDDGGDSGESADGEGGRVSEKEVERLMRWAMDAVRLDLVSNATSQEEDGARMEEEAEEGGGRSIWCRRGRHGGQGEEKGGQTRCQEASDQEAVRLPMYRPWSHPVALSRLFVFALRTSLNSESVAASSSILDMQDQIILLCQKTGTCGIVWWSAKTPGPVYLNCAGPFMVQAAAPRREKKGQLQEARSLRLHCGGGRCGR